MLNRIQMAHARNGLILATALLVASAALGGCIEFSRTPASSSTGNARSLAGEWLSTAPGSPPASSCSNFQWEITNTQGATVSGDFSATCGGGVGLSGTATGTQEVSVFRWSASGMAAAPDVPDCTFSLTGTATPGVSTIEIEYSGSTCLGPVSGTETLSRS